jgi:hypothetical protein
MCSESGGQSNVLGSPETGFGVRSVVIGCEIFIEGGCVGDEREGTRGWNNRHGQENEPLTLAGNVSNRELTHTAPTR